MAPTQAHSPPQGLSVAMYPSRIFFLMHIFSKHAFMFTWSQIFCDLLFSCNETFSLQDAGVYFICLTSENHYQCGYLEMYLAFSINECLGCFWLFIFSPLPVWPLVTGLFKHLEHFSRQRCGIAVGNRWGILHFDRHCQIALYKHHHKFHSYQQWKRYSLPFDSCQQ